MSDNDEYKKRLSPLSVTFEDKIGEGGFAVVYKVQLTTEEGQTIQAAAKRVDSLSEREVEYLARLQHPDIITYLGYFKEIDGLTIVTELAEKGDLKSYLRSSQNPLSRDLATTWMKGAARGLQYLHHNNVVHRDIKSGNFLIMSDNTLKLADFGLAKDLDETMSTVSSGTVRWMAPEVFRDLKRSKMSDIHAYAIVIWEILYRRTPFEELEADYAIMTAVCDGRRPVIQEDCPDRFRWLMENGWHWDYQQRPTIDTILVILEADEEKSIEEILEKMKEGKQQQTKNLESNLFHPEEQTEMEKLREKTDKETQDHRREMDELEELKQRMRRKGREKAKKAKEPKH